MQDNLVADLVPVMKIWREASGGPYSFVPPSNVRGLRYIQALNSWLADAGVQNQ